MKIEKREIVAFTEEQASIVSAAGEILAGTGGFMLSNNYGGHAFMAMIEKRPGDYVSGYGETAAEAFAIAIGNYQAWEPADQPIRSAVEAVDVIRERIAAGEDVNAVLADIKVA